MRRISFASFAIPVVVLGCAGSPEVYSASAPEPMLEPEPAPITEPVVAAPQPTEEELKRAEELRKLETERAQLQADHQAELQRFTPELRASASALAEKGYPNARAALRAALASEHRKPGNADRDRHRHPLETLEFFGLRTNMSVLEYGPGEGWYTELLAPALAKQGKLFVSLNDPNGPAEERATLYGQRTRLMLDKSPELFGKIEAITIDPKAPRLPLDGTLDMVLSVRNLHGMHNSQTLDAWLAEFHRALKPNGVLAVVQHRGAPGSDPDQTAKLGYLPEAWVIEKVQASGFKLGAKSEINANPKDTKDHPEGVWALPPTLRHGDQDREKYLAIGESDRMTLRFVKVKKSAPAAQSGGPPAPAGAMATPAPAGATATSAPAK